MPKSWFYVRGTKTIEWATMVYSNNDTQAAIDGQAKADEAFECRKPEAVAEKIADMPSVVEAGWPKVGG